MPDTPPPHQEYYPIRSDWVQRLCPVPKRFLQRLILKHNLKTGLDIGCGRASPFTSLRRFGFKSTGMDINAEQLEDSRSVNCHDEYIQGNFLTMDLGRKFDVVILSDVIEHFTKDDGWNVMRRMEELSSRVVYIETPHGFIEQLPFDGNIYQRHHSGWFTEDFEGHCYNVFGSGVGGLHGSGSKPPKINPTILRLMDRLTQWYYFRRPRKAAILAAIKYIDENGDIRQI